MASNTYPRPRGQASHPSPDATTHSNSHDGLAEQGSAYDYQDQADLLGAMFPYSSTTRTFTSQQGFLDARHSSVYNTSNGEEPGQQDDLTLTGANGQDFPFFISNAAQSSDSGITPNFSLERHRLGEPQPAPWNPFVAAGGPTSSKIRSQTSHSQSHLSPQNQTLANRRTSSRPSLPDSGYYTLSSSGRKDAYAHETETTGTAETIAEMMNAGFPFNSQYQASLTESDTSGLPEQSLQKEEQMCRASVQQQQASSQGQHGQPISCPHGCKQVFTTPSQLTKHVARHDLIHKCQVPGCKRTKGFSTVNDLDRHKRTVHKQFSLGHVYKCFGKSCLKSSKLWPRLDNFKNHIAKLHPDEDVDALIKRAEEDRDACFQRAVDSQGNTVEGQQRNRSTGSPFTSTSMPPRELSSAGSPVQSYGPPPPTITVSPQDLDQRNSTSQFLSTGWDQPRLPGSGRSRSVVDVPLTASSMSRQGSSSLRAQGTTSTRASVPLTQSSRPMRQLNQYPPPEYQNSVPHITTTRPNVSSQERQAPRPLPSGPQRHHPVFRAQIPRDSPNAFLAIHGRSRGGLKANTAPVAEMAPLKERLNDVESTMPSASYQMPPSDRQSLLAVGLGSHLDSEAISESPSDCINLGGMDQCSTGDFQSEEVRLLQSVISQLPQDADQQFAEEVFKTTLRSMKSASQGPGSSAALTPKDVNPGHNLKIKKSDGKEAYVCSVCKKETKRLSEMNKHERRHTKPYGCTFDDCYKKFGSKNDLKRHEHSQHEQLECWRCEELLEGSTPCYQLFHRRDYFATHLMKDHGYPDEAATKEPLKTKRISRAHQLTYWCGFCRCICTMDKKGISGDNERFDHIVKHFIREGREIEEWLPTEGHKTKGLLRAEKEAKNSSATEKSEESQEEDGDEQGDEDDDDDDCEGESEEMSPISLEGPPIRGEDSSRTTLQLQTQQHRKKRGQPIDQQYQSPPPTNKKRKAATDAGAHDSSTTEPNADPQAPAAREAKKRFAESAVCCQCQEGRLLLESPQLLANSKTCMTCSHRFCNDCWYTRVAFDNWR